MKRKLGMLTLIGCALFTENLKTMLPVSAVQDEAQSGLSLQIDRFNELIYSNFRCAVQAAWYRLPQNSSLISTLYYVFGQKIEGLLENQGQDVVQLIQNWDFSELSKGKSDIPGITPALSKNIYAPDKVQQALTQKKTRKTYQRDAKNIPQRNGYPGKGIDILSVAMKNQKLKNPAYQSLSPQIDAEIIIASISELMENTSCLHWGVYNYYEANLRTNILCFGLALEISDGVPMYYEGGKQCFDKFIFIPFQLPFSQDYQPLQKQVVTAASLYSLQNDRELDGKFGRCIIKGNIPFFALREACREYFDLQVSIDVEKRRLETVRGIVLRKTEEYRKINGSLLDLIRKNEELKTSHRNEISRLTGTDEDISLTDPDREIELSLKHMSDALNELDQKRARLLTLTSIQKEFKKSKRSLLINFRKEFNKLRSMSTVCETGPESIDLSEADRFKNETASIPLPDSTQVYSPPSEFWSLDLDAVKSECEKLRNLHQNISSGFNKYCCLSSEDSLELGELLENAHNYRRELARLEIEKEELSKVSRFLRLRDEISKESERLNSAIVNVEERIAEIAPPSPPPPNVAEIPESLNDEIPESLNDEKEAEEIVVPVRNEGGFLWRCYNFIFGFWRR
jgi:hypothetical protein